MQMCNVEQLLFLQAISFWGAHTQIQMAIEEMSELITELCRFSRSRPNIEEISEEMADVALMLQQLKTLFQNERRVEQYYEEKLTRLRKRLDKEIVSRIPSK